MSQKIGNYRAAEEIARFRDFDSHTGSLRGRQSLDGWGILPNALEIVPRDARYYIYSYATPIGWLTADGRAQMPDAKYSVTTSRHQGIARQGFRAAGLAVEVLPL